MVIEVRDLTEEEQKEIEKLNLKKENIYVSGDMPEELFNQLKEVLEKLDCEVVKSPNLKLKK